MRICFDFDDTLAKGDELLEPAASLLKKYHQEGHEITIFTSKHDSKYAYIRDWLISHNIPFERIITGKPLYDLFYDDKAEKITGWEPLGISRVESLETSSQKRRITKEEAEDMIKKYQTKL